jgi:hypothetical protein
MRQPGHFGQRGLPTTISAALLSSYQESDLPPTLCQSNPFSLPGVAGRPCPFGQVIVLGMILPELRSGARWPAA